MTSTRTKKPKTLSNAAAIDNFVLNAFPDGVPASDMPTVTAAQLLARAVDADPSVASLWRQYREALADLLEATEQDGDEIEWLVGQLSSSGSDTED
jgi:uncharacterized tellurite resistance protein B-like protein